MACGIFQKCLSPAIDFTFRGAIRRYICDVSAGVNETYLSLLNILFIFLDTEPEGSSKSCCRMSW